MNAKKAKALRRIVRAVIESGYSPLMAKTRADYLNATPKQISRAFDVVLGTRNFRNRSPYMIAA